MKKKPKVVIDTNVIVSGILTRNGYSAKIIDAWMTGKYFVPVISNELISEIKEVLQRPKIKNRLSTHPKNIKLILGRLINQSEKITIKKTVDGLFSDSKDHFLLELAVTADAKIIVTGDSGIIQHMKYGEIFFQTPEQFCKKMEIS